MSRREILKWALWVLLLSRIGAARSLCTGGCTLAYGAYRVKENDTVDNIVKFFRPVTTADVQQYSGLPNANFIDTGSLLKIPFSCDCINGNFLGHNFVYAIQSGDTYEKISDHYSNLTSSAWLQATNSYPETRIPDTGSLNVTINCSCGNAEVSPNYGLFLTYPLTAGDNVSGLSSQYNVTADLLQKYNPSVDFKLGSGLVFIPVQGLDGSYHPLSPSTGLAVGAIAGISVAVIIVALFLAAFLWIAFAKRRKQKDGQLIPSDSGIEISKQTFGSLNRSDEFGVSLGPSGITVDKSVEFTYEELAEATNDFSMANKIGQGGFGAVYYAELRGEQAAVKRMEMESSSSTESFLAELKVLTRVHHVNLVRLIGYCTDRALFLVYEYIDNGNLSQHLHGTAGRPLSFSERVQIALDSARGLEYIHEHTVPVYIHRDIKSANILIDKRFHGKVADFGLAKLTEVGGASLNTRLVGTFGYMPPEYARFGDVSTKIDVYAFGVVLYELISAKEAVLRTGASTTETKGLVAMFDNAFAEANPKENLKKLVDPRLGDSYPIDSVYKMAELGKLCTQESPQDRPPMRSVVVALMALSSSSEDWDVGTFYENKALINLMAGR
ncbi:chitin elicitor receptor kinase 1 [Nymphaea colorata]|nr:chitin elicitor receptor kinase 1 [Nymphaea colorata]